MMKNKSQFFAFIFGLMFSLPALCCDFCDDNKGFLETKLKENTAYTVNVNDDLLIVSHSSYDGCLFLHAAESYCKMIRLLEVTKRSELLPIEQQMLKRNCSPADEYLRFAHPFGPWFVMDRKARATIGIFVFSLPDEKGLSTMTARLFDDDYWARILYQPPLFLEEFLTAMQVPLSRYVGKEFDGNEFKGLRFFKKKVSSFPSPSGERKVFEFSFAPNSTEFPIECTLDSAIYPGLEGCYYTRGVMDRLAQWETGIHKYFDRDTLDTLTLVAYSVSAFGIGLYGLKDKILGLFKTKQPKSKIPGEKRSDSGSSGRRQKPMSIPENLGQRRTVVFDGDSLQVSARDDSSDVLEEIDHEHIQTTQVRSEPIEKVKIAQTPRKLKLKKTTSKTPQQQGVQRLGPVAPENMHTTDDFRNGFSDQIPDIQRRIQARLRDISEGRYGKMKAIWTNKKPTFHKKGHSEQGTVFELKWGDGLRVYFVSFVKKRLFLKIGDKNSQKSDIGKIQEKEKYSEGDLGELRLL